MSVASTYWGTLPELLEVIELARAGHISAAVERFGLDEAVDAYRQLRAGEVRGRAVIVPETVIHDQTPSKGPWALSPGVLIRRILHEWKRGGEA